MKKMDKKILIRYLSQEASDAERLAVEKWRKASSDHETLFAEYERLWQEESYKSILSPDAREQDWCLICGRVGFRKKTAFASDSIWPAFVRIAAVLVLIFAVSGVLWTYWNVPGFGRWTSFKTGEYVDSLKLPDNSLVYLNRYSSLTYRNDFGESQRDVLLTGEGYFEVTSDALHPFRVGAGDDLAVEVVGTSFHIKTSDNVKDFELNVTEGTVLCKYSLDAESVRAGNSARVSDSGILVRPIMDSNFISWKTGEIEIVNKSLPEIIDILKHHYKEIKKVQQSASSDVLVTTRFEKQPLREVLDELAIHFNKKFEFKEGVLTISE